MRTPVYLLPEKIILSLASRYIAGKDARDSLSLAHDLCRQNRFTGTLDLLGEAATSAEQCQGYVDKFINAIDLVSEDPLAVQDKQKRLTISCKPSMFCVADSPDTLPSKKNLEEGYERIKHVIQYALKRGVPMTLEAEDHRWADFQLDSYFSLLNAGCSNLGTVLQTRLFRTERDIMRFDHRGRVRLVIGIYEESSEIAYTDKRQMKDLLIAYSRQLLEKGAYVEFATHDQHYVEKFFADIALPLRIGANRFETQFLFGVPRLKLQKALASGEYFEQWKGINPNMADQLYLETLGQSGVVVRFYLPFGPDESAVPYCKRRLESNPNLLLYGLKNLVGMH